MKNIKTFSAAVLVFAILADCADAAPPLEPSAHRDMADYVKTLVGVYNGPGSLSGNFAANGPFLGNGDMRVMLLGNWETQTFHISEADMWTDGDSGNRRQITTGGLTFSAAPVNGGDKVPFRQEQHLWDPHIVADSAAGFHTRSTVFATENVMIVELWTDSQVPLPMTVSLWTKADKKDLPAQAGIQDGLMWATRQTKASNRWVAHNALATKLIGTKATIASDGDGKVSAKFQLSRGQKVTVVTVLKGGWNVAVPLPLANARAAAMQESDLADLQKKHVRWWRDYWNQTWLRTYDETFDKVYFGALYMTACVNGSGATPAGQYPLCFTDDPGWSGDYHMNQEYMGQYCWAFSGNRPASIQNVFQPMVDFIPEGKIIAEKHMSEIAGGWAVPCRGICYPVGLLPHGVANGYYYWNQVSNASYTGQLFIWNYEYYHDLEWLRKTGYPFVRLLGDFWESHLRKEGDRLVSYGATYEQKFGKNPIIDLALARRVFTALIAFSKDLNVDADKRPQWQAIVDHLSELPTMEFQGGRVFVSHEGCGDVPNFADIECVFPAGVVDLASPDALLRTALKTLDVVNGRWLGAKTGIHGVRLGYPVEQLRAAVKAACITCGVNDWVGLRPNLTIGDFHSTGELLEFLQISMLLSLDDGIRIFPSRCAGQPAAFQNLRARGAFVVSSVITQDDAPEAVSILSEKGIPCTLVNPWPGERVTLFRNGKQAETLSGPRLTFKTAASETVLVGPEGVTASALRDALMLPPSKMVSVLVNQTPAQSPLWTLNDLELQAGPQADIFYTLDGSRPTRQSQHYTVPLRAHKPGVLRVLAVEPGHGGTTARFPLKGAENGTHLANTFDSAADLERLKITHFYVSEPPRWLDQAAPGIRGPVPGKHGILGLCPEDRQTPAEIERFVQIPAANKHPKLRVVTAADPNDANVFFIMQAGLSTDGVHTDWFKEERINAPADGWKTFDYDLSKYGGQSILIKVKAGSGGAWYNNRAYFDEISVVAEGVVNKP